MSALDVVLSLAALPVLAAAVYLGGLALLSRMSAPPPVSAPRLRFDVVVPAYDEEAGIGRTVASLLAIDYPRPLFRVLVVADNCRDGTGAAAKAAGADVLVRTDPERRGKGHALAYAYDRCLKEARSDAVAVVDADTVVSPNLLAAFSARLEAGAVALQAGYGVANPEASWRTRLLAIAFTAIHAVRSLARERLGLSCGLRGNGMAFSASLLRAVPHRAFTVVEDLEHGIRLGDAGYRVHYVHEARVLGDMASSERASRSQRRRWEEGRWVLAWRHVPRLLSEAWSHRDPVRLDLALDLLVPPLAWITLATATGGLLCGLAAWLGRGMAVAPWLWGASALGLVLYVGRGWWLSGTGVRGLLDLAWAPLYVLWKLTLPFRARTHRADEWVRTSRGS